ncbi:polysaccharide lyase family 7 protein [Ekhidna sp.]|uniref:polysaccharide lyase family 7 protein n=1 Tax=Ekhidna sp. TaxID=2608089 RepID=UPI003BA89B32
MKARKGWFDCLLGFEKRFICNHFLVSFVLAFFAVTICFAQDPNLPPSGNFDLSKWKITLPDQTEIKENELSNGFESENEFYTDPTTGAMVFRCRNDGQTGGSTYPRSELREMLRAGNTSISTQGIGLNNWVFSSSSTANQEASGGVDGTMTATVAVDHVSTTGESNKVGRVIVGQIHASNDEPCRIYYRKLPNNTKGSIYFAHEPTTSSEQWYEMIGSRSSSASDPTDGIALGEKFSYEIDVVGNTLTVTIMRDGKADIVQEVDMTDSGFADDWMYFKAGNYNQNNSGDPGDYAQVSFFTLNVSHSGTNSAPSVSITDPSNNDSFIESEDITISANASDSDGTISKVEFFEGSNKLGEDSSSPYSFDWENVAEGSYSLTAIATDDKGSTTTSSEVNITVNSQPTGYDAPYDIPKFQAFIGGSKLQAPTSSTIASQSDLINGYSSDNFYVVDGDKIAFNQTGSSMRTELRHLTNWTLTDGDRSFHGSLTFVEQTCDQVTVVQIHDDANEGSGPNKPLLRIYKHQTKSPVNHLWAAVKTDATGDNTTHVDLGLAPTDYFSFDVRLVGGNMIIDIDGEEKANLDVSFWTFPSYWKAGVYLQDEGEATVYFDELYEGDGSVINHGPSVGITSPTNGESFNSGSDITITADAFDTDGSISLVEFFQGNEKLGEDATAPYEIIWNDVPFGDYTLTAIATDNEGATSKSLGIDISLGVQYTLSTSTTGEGSISLNPSGGSYAENTVVSLTATPSSGYQFDGWSGDLSGRQNPVSITMDSDKSVEASFIPIYTLTTSVVGDGSITLSPSGGTYEEGTVVTLTAVPDSGNQLESWSGDASGTEDQITVTMNSNKSVTATFGVALSVDGDLAETKYDLVAYPNPFDLMATFEYRLSAITEVELSIYDVMGKKVEVLVNKSQSHGDYAVEWTPKNDLPNGLYFAKMTIGNETKSLKIILDR